MGNEKVGQIIDAFKDYDPKLYVIAIWKINEKNGSYLVVAKHTPSKEAVEMDPFYIYNSELGIDGVTYVDNRDAFQKIMKPGNLIYEIKD